MSEGAKLESASSPRSHANYSASLESLPTMRWFQRPSFWAMATAISIFPLIWMGGLVTTHDAGMAVPDWPGTYGYNLLLYPIGTWLSGPFDLFVEHGHRLLGALAGFLSIAVVVTAYNSKSKSTLLRWSIVLLIAICLQGALGGIRVLQTNRIMAMVHGCTGPMVFALAAYVALVASRGFVDRDGEGSKKRWSIRFAWLVTSLAMVQLIIGAALRHLNVNLRPAQFMGLTHLHLTVAVMLTLSVLVLFAVALATRKRTSSVLPCRLPGSLVLLILVQVCLGCLTWYVNYALPWDALSQTLSAHVNHLKGLSETMIVTAHQAVGSLILLIAFLIAVHRQFAPAIQYERKLHA
jgi:heme a synthase